MSRHGWMVGALALGFVLCSTHESSAVVYNFDADGAGFTVDTPIAFDGPWVYSATAGVGGTGAWATNGQVVENQHANTTNLISPGYVMSQPGTLSLSFDHKFGFESGSWDGGAIFVRVNGGAFTYVPLVSFLANGYNGTVLPNSASDLHGVQAFVENSPGLLAGDFITSSALLGIFGAGDTVQVMFKAAGDTNSSGPLLEDWVIDNVALLEANAIPEPSSLMVLGFGMAAAIGWRARRRG